MVFHELLNVTNDLFARYQTGAFVLAVGVFKFRTPKIVVMVKVAIYIIPTSIATVRVKHTVRRIKFTNG